MEYEGKVRVLNGTSVKFLVKDYALREWQNRQPEEKLPPAWVDTHSLTPEQHLRIQAVIQPYVDNAISKTINLPVDFPFDQLSEVYSMAYKSGLKGCTIFRPNEVTGSVLTVPSPDDLARCC